MNQRAPHPSFRPAQGAGEGLDWAGVDRLDYKSEGEAPFRGISRRVLFDQPELQGQLRYFEIEPGGYSTLERHEHAHAVVILHGAGRALVGRAVRPVAVPDLVWIAPWSWHQFRAAADRPLGFLCLVNQERDRPQLPTPAERAELAREPALAAFFAGN